MTGIRYWSTADYTRVAIDLDREVKYESGRVPDPDRIFFDLPDTRLVSTLVGKSFDVQDGFLKKIRVSQYQRGSTRVVLEVDDVTEYSAFLLPNPYRLIIDIHGKDTTGQRRWRRTLAGAAEYGSEERGDGCATVPHAKVNSAQTRPSAAASTGLRRYAKPEQKAGDDERRQSRRPSDDAIPASNPPAIEPAHDHGCV